MSDTDRSEDIRDLQAEVARLRELHTQQMACIQIIARGDEPNIIADFPAAEDVRRLWARAEAAERERDEWANKAVELELARRLLLMLNAASAAEGPRCVFHKESHGLLRRCELPAGHEGDHIVPMAWGPRRFRATPGGRDE